MTFQILVSLFALVASTSSAFAGSDSMIVASCRGSAGSTAWYLDISKNVVTKRLEATLTSSLGLSTEPYKFEVSLDVGNREFKRTYEGQGFELTIGYDNGRSSLSAVLDHGRPFNDDTMDDSPLEMICSY